MWQIASLKTGDRDVKKRCLASCDDRCFSVRHWDSAAVEGLPEGAETPVQRAEGVSEEAPEENLRAAPRVQQQVQEDDSTVQQEQVHTRVQQDISWPESSVFPC